jgi:hypothetical protein
MFIDRLFNEGIIVKRLFSFSLGGTNEKSKIVFGDYDLSKYAQPKSEISWNKL